MAMNSDATAWSQLHNAYTRPWEVADDWRRSEGKVVGVLGHDLPREVIAATGLLPMRLSPLRLDREGHQHAGAVPDALRRELTPPTAMLLGALLDGKLDWVDGIAIGRDTEAYTTLFYVIRELARCGRWQGLPPFAFCDSLRLVSRPSARYNRIQAREFADTLVAWGGRTIDEPSLGAAIDDQVAISRLLGEIALRRTAPPTALRGSHALIAAGAASMLPAGRARALLGAWLDTTGESPPQSLRVFVTGSGQDDPFVYEELEREGAAIVGEDHEWGDGGDVAAERSADPWDRLVDRYQLGAHGAARSGLWERTSHTALLARQTDADAVLQLVYSHDEAPAWEFPELRRALGDDMSLKTVQLEYGNVEAEALRTALAAVRRERSDV